MAARTVTRTTLQPLATLALILLFPGLVSPAQFDASGFELALPGYVYEFPRDHGSHDSYRTEWWYFTGQVRSSSGRAYGFELTFFRVGFTPPSKPPETAWDLRNLALAHFAITDIDRGEFRYHEKLSRATRYTAVARQGSLDVFNEGWRVTDAGDGSFRLRARDGSDAIDLHLLSRKPPAVHGAEGISVKGEGVGNASHYYSLTRLAVSGTIAVSGKAEKCQGQAWMDHEFGSSYLRDEQGWDWFSLQMDNETELMIYLLRRPNGSADPASGGSMILADGSVIHLKRDDIQVQPLGRWKSKASGATYPMGWRIRILPISLDVTVREKVRNQELITRASTQVTYWEGAVGATGSFGGTSVRGDGYVEMTGYAR